MTASILYRILDLSRVLYSVLRAEQSKATGNLATLVHLHSALTPPFGNFATDKLRLALAQITGVRDLILPVGTDNMFLWVKILYITIDSMYSCIFSINDITVLLTLGTRS